MVLSRSLRAGKSIFSSIAIELNVPRDEFSSIAIKITFVTCDAAFKAVRPGTRIFA